MGVPNASEQQSNADDKIADISESMEISQKFQADLMILQNIHQTTMQAYQAQKKMYEQIRA